MVIYEQGKVGQHSQRAARVTLNAPFNSRSVEINQCALIYKRAQGNIPNYLNKLLVINSNIHARNTRYCN